jgi:hypothetical protein
MLNLFNLHIFRGLLDLYRPLASCRYLTHIEVGTLLGWDKAAFSVHFDAFLFLPGLVESLNLLLNMSVLSDGGAFFHGPRCLELGLEGAFLGIALELIVFLGFVLLCLLLLGEGVELFIFLSTSSP